MSKAIFMFATLLLSISLYAQVDYTANETVTPYPGVFRPGLNLGYYPGFTDMELANLAAGNPEIGNKGLGVKAVRPGMFDSFTSEYGYDARVETYNHFLDLDLKDNTLIVGFPADEHQDQTEYCTGIQSELFANMYEPIWDNGENGTPINEENYYAVYLWNLVSTYSDHVKFWEIWNEPGLDYTGTHGWLPPGAPGSWWDNDPDPCQYKLRAPIQHYVRLLRISWEIIKTEDPTGYVVVSGTGYPSFLDAILRNTDNPTDGSVSPDFPLGGGAYFDVMGFHSYPHFDGSMRKWNNDINGWEYLRHSDAGADGLSQTRADYQEVLDTYGYDGATYPEKLWTITECNLPRVAYGEFIGSNEAQRNFMVKAYVECVVNDFKQINIYKLAEDKTEATAYNEFDLMGMYAQLSPNEGYFNEILDEGIAMRTTSNILFDKTYDPVRTADLELTDDLKGAAFKDDFGNYTYVLWARTQTDMSEEANGIYTFPQELGLTTLMQKNWDFSANVTMTYTEPTNIPLTATPIFLSEQVVGVSQIIGCAPLNVQFTDESNTDAVAWQWVFDENDMPTYSSLQNPAMNYFQPGNYTATMQAFDAAGDLIAMQTQHIEVQGVPTLNFVHEVSGPLVNFTNLSDASIENFEWDFGDGTTSNEASPTHVYYNSGTYEVVFSTTNECGQTTVNQTIIIEVPTTTMLTETANEYVAPYDAPFRTGYNFFYYPPWNDMQLSNIAAGNPTENIKGAGAKSVRVGLSETFVNIWGYDARLSTFQHYQNLDLYNNSLILEIPSPASTDSTEYCPGKPSKLFKDLYVDIWDNGENGTPVNDANPWAVYVYNMVQTYGDYVRFYEIYQEPDFDRTGDLGWLPPGEEGNWWENDPQPCDYHLRAPITHYIRMLRIAYEIIHTYDEDSYVTLSDLAYPSFLDAILRNTDNPADGSPAVGYELGGGAYFDAVGFKSFPHIDGSTATYDGGWVYSRHSDAAAAGIAGGKAKFDAVLANYGYNDNQYPEKQWIISEANVPRANISSNFGGEIQQVNWMIKAHINAIKQDIRAMHIFSIAEEEWAGNATSTFDIMGLYQKLEGIPYGSQTINNEGIAMRTCTQLLYNRSYSPTRTAELALPANIDGAAFVDNSGHYTYVLWAKTTTDLSEEANASYSFPASFALTQIYKRAWDFGETEAYESIVSSNIELTATPIFLTELEDILPPPIAAFTAVEDLACPGENIIFQNTSIGQVDSYHWTFEGGNPATSTVENPVINYANAGEYDVTLTVTNASGTHNVSYTNFVEIVGEASASFTATIDGANGAAVTFENTSEDAYYYNWDFGDFHFSGEAQPDTHIYDENGTYIVELIAHNQCYDDTITQTILIAAAPTAQFSTIFSDDCDDFSVQLTNESLTSPETYLWSFPEGTPSTSSEENPSVFFPQGGTYTIQLTATNAFGSHTISQEIHVIGNIENNIHADLCEGEYFEINGQQFDENNPTGTLELTAVSGCDSTINITTQTFENQELTIDTTILIGEEIVIGNSTYTDAGIYADILQTVNGCDSIVNLLLTVITSTNEAQNNTFAANIVPNPFQDKTTTLQFALKDPAILTIKVLNVHGKVVQLVANNQAYTAENQTIRIALENLSAGVYFCQIQDTKGATQTLRMVSL